jgi:hypothetical protein
MYAQCPKLSIRKAVIVMYMIAMLVLKVHLSSLRYPSENQMVRRGDGSLRIADICPMPLWAEPQQQSTPLSISRTSHENVFDRNGLVGRVRVLTSAA